MEESHGEQADDGDGFREDLHGLFVAGSVLFATSSPTRRLSMLHVGAARVYDL